MVVESLVMEGLGLGLGLGPGLGFGLQILLMRLLGKIDVKVNMSMKAYSAFVDSISRCIEANVNEDMFLMTCLQSCIFTCSFKLIYNFYKF